jgi:hypothetical protein
MPEVRYRAGLVLYLNQAKANLFNPKFKSEYPNRVFKQLDEAFKAVARHVGDESGEHVPDLTKEGPEGEYEELAPVKG